MKYTVITGASSGIGYESALAFASRGKNLILVARRQEELDGLKQRREMLKNSLSPVQKIRELVNTEESYHDSNVELYEGWRGNY